MRTRGKPFLYRELIGLRPSSSSCRAPSSWRGAMTLRTNFFSNPASSTASYPAAIWSSICLRLAQAFDVEHERAELLPRSVDRSAPLGNGGISAAGHLRGFLLDSLRAGRQTVQVVFLEDFWWSNEVVITSGKTIKMGEVDWVIVDPGLPTVSAVCYSGTPAGERRSLPAAWRDHR